MPRSRPLVPLAFWLLPVLLACSSDCKRKSSDQPLSGEDSLENALAQSLVPSRQVVRLEGLPASEPCPTVMGWSASALFSGNTSPGANEWCLYESANLDPSEAKQGWLKWRLGWTGYKVLGPAPDRVALSVAGDFDEDMRSLLDERFVARRGTLAYGGPVEGAEPSVRLTLLDTSENFEGDDPFSKGREGWHGYVLANLAREMLCLDEAGACPVQIRTRQALGRDFTQLKAKLGIRQHADLGVAPARTPPVGAPPVSTPPVGTLLDLAQAIDLEVQDWRSAGGSSQNLILNLSIGWNAGLQKPKDDVAAQAVHDALLHARCQGAISFAAAGNLDGGGGKKLHRGLLFPAGWMIEPVTAEDCAAVVGDEQNALAGHTDAVPLIYAVGSVSNAGPTLGVSRIEGLPPLLATGDHAVAHTPGGEALAPMTGTSVSTLLVAATAAALWHNDPTLSPPALEEALLTAGGAPGPDTPTAIDLSPDAPIPDKLVPAAWVRPRLIDLCSGQPRLEPAGSGGDPVESAPPAPGRYACASAANWIRPLPLQVDDLLPALSAVTATEEVAYTPTTLADDTCESANVFCPTDALSGFALSKCNDVHIDDDGGLPAACLSRQRFGPSTAPYVWPQPSWPDCPHCLVIARDKLSTTLYRELLTTDVSTTQVEIDVLIDATRTTEIYPLPLIKTGGSNYVSFNLSATSAALDERSLLTGARLVLANKQGAVRVIPLSVSQ